MLFTNNVKARWGTPVDPNITPPKKLYFKDSQKNLYKIEEGKKSHVSPVTCHLSPVICLVLPTFQAMSVKAVLMLKPLEAFSKGFTL